MNPGSFEKKTEAVIYGLEVDFAVAAPDVDRDAVFEGVFHAVRRLFEEVNADLKAVGYDYPVLAYTGIPVFFKLAHNIMKPV